MVFPASLPLYLDPPNWQPQPLPNGGETTDNPNQVIPPPPPPLGASGGGGGCGSVSSIRPGSMTDRARLAKIPQPEPGLKCPRCESTNTKFCYFNNYNLSQPRHFCKTCRRYWTRGGALRNVPVGGGCRRNKRSKPRNRSKSPAGELRIAGSTSTATVSPQSHLPFFPSLHHLSDYGLNLGIFPPPAAAGPGCTPGSGHIEFPGVANSSGYVQQFPFVQNLDQPTVVYTFEPSDGTAESTRYNLAGQLGFSKQQIEGNGITPAKNFQFWPAGGGNNVHAWAGADIAGFSSSSSAGHFL